MHMVLACKNSESWIQYICKSCGTYPMKLSLLNANINHCVPFQRMLQVTS